METTRTSGLVQDWMLKLCAIVTVMFVFFGSLRYASGHVWSPAAPLRPMQADATLNGATLAPRRGGLALPFVTTNDVPTTTQAPVTHTRQS